MTTEPEGVGVLVGGEYFEEERQEMKQHAEEQVDTVMKFLRRCREESDITQEEMGRALGVKQRTVSDLERSDNPGLRRVMEYAYVLGFVLTPVLEDLAQRSIEHPFVENA